VSADTYDRMTATVENEVSRLRGEALNNTSFGTAGGIIQPSFLPHGAHQMLTLSGPRHRSYCDGIPRREFLKIGGFSMAGTASLTLPELLQAESQASGGSSPGSSHKSVINIFLGGGPPHQDMWEIKTDAPQEIRGEFNPISTAVPGLQIGECFPRIASMAEKFVFLRAITGCSGRHDAFQCLSGWPRNADTSIGGRPAVGPVLAKLQGPVHPSVPPAMALAEKTRHEPWSEPGGPGFLGAAYAPFKPDSEGMSNLELNGVTLDRLQDRALKALAPLGSSGKPLAEMADFIASRDH